jgi:hypothetical protein
VSAPDEPNRRLRTVVTAACPTCGRPIDAHNRHVRFGLPDPVLAIPPDERASRTWGADPMIQVQGVGAFVRVLLPIRLTDGYTLTVGTWLAINPSHLRAVWERWETSEYSSLVVEGFLANEIPPWGAQVLGASSTAEVRDPEQLPYLSASGHPRLSAILGTEWPPDVIFSAYQKVL